MILDRYHQIRKMFINVNIKDLNPHLLCVLCGGYYIDATTIVECLHSFCRSCIVKHLESSKYCPICEVMVHKTKPLANIRLDKTLQNLVYKLVPGLYEREKRNRRQFYIDRPHYVKPDDPESGGEENSEKSPFDKNVTVRLRYKSGETNQEISNTSRFLRCPIGVTVKHLQKLIRAKFGLEDAVCQVQLMCKDQILHEELTLMDVSCLYLNRYHDDLELSYVIYEKTSVKPLDIKEEVGSSNKSSETLVKKEEVIEKEFQLRITESGVMSVSQVDSRQIIGCTNLEPGTVNNSTEIVPLNNSKELNPKVGSTESRPVIGPAVANTTLESDSLSLEVKLPVVKEPLNECNQTKTDKSEDKKCEKWLLNNSARILPTKRHSFEKDKPPIKQKRPSLNEENGVVVKKPLIIPNIGSSEIVLKMSGASLGNGTSNTSNTNATSSTTATTSSTAITTAITSCSSSKAPVAAATNPKVANDTIPVTNQSPAVVDTSVPPRTTAASIEKMEKAVVKPNEKRADTPISKHSATTSPVVKSPEPVKPQTSSADLNFKRQEKPPCKVVHRSIRTTPKIWHPTITKEKLRPTLMKSSDEPRKPINKFFKARQMPRFLGNPASGVKPMYSNGLPPATPPAPSRTLDQIVRIDPKTLRPMQKDEKKAPNTLLTNPFIPRDNHFLLPDPKTQPFSPLNLPPSFHPSLPPTISHLINPHQHFRNLKAKEEAAKNCDKKPEAQSSASSSAVVDSSAVDSSTTDATQSKKCS